MKANLGMTDHRDEPSALCGGDSLEGGWPVVEPIKAANFPCWLMRIISTVVRSEVDRQMEPLGLTQAQWIPVLRLASGEAQTAADLARSSMQTPGAMTRLVDRLVEKGIIERERCTDDRRVVRLRLTEEGMRAAVQVPDIVKSVNAAALSPLSSDELAQFQSYLRRIYEAMPHTLNTSMGLADGMAACGAAVGAPDATDAPNTPGAESSL